jgi:large subunit ribosomal protein L25
MAGNRSTSLKVAPREPGGSRTARRLRREGSVPGVVYGGGEDPVSFSVPARELRLALAAGGAVIDLAVEGSGATPVVVKVLDRHPVSSETVHVDLLRVRLDEKIQSTAFLELTGIEDAPGTKEGGVLEHITRELTISALPNDIPDSLSHDIGQMQIGDTLTLDALRPPSGVELLDDPETVIATLTPPKLQLEEDDAIEEETALVGEDGEPVEASAQDTEGGDSEGEGGRSDDGGD